MNAHVPHRLRRGWPALALAAVLTLGACTAEAEGGGSAMVTAAREVSSGTGVWDASQVHEISVEVDPDELAAMLETYASTSEKEWVSATVTIDGTTYEQVGLRLKGNSSLRGADADSDPTDLPWLVRLDKFVDGQSADGYAEFVVRSNSTTTAINEAVALDLLREAGLASEYAVASGFSVNGGESALRLVVQNLDETWEEENFSTTGLLYKSEAEGDWSWRGEDPEEYVDVFDQETGEEDLTPLIEFLDFLNNSSDEEFAADLEEHLDVEAFARYLAFEELVDNFDDIDGPGNNSFLRWDAETDGFTVVAWDHNLAFGGSPGGGRGGAPGGGRGGEGFAPPEGFEPPADGERPEMPEGFEPPADGERPEMPEGEMPEGFEPPEGGGGGPGGRSNVLVERFSEVEEFADLLEQARTDLRAELYDSGLAEEVVQRWEALLTEQAGDLVEASTVTTEADAVRDSISG